MHFHILTLFPELFASVLSATMLQKGQERGALQFSLHNIRDFALDKHRVTDDTPYGGGEGMVMKPEPIVAALESLAAASGRPHRILLSPRGSVLTQQRAGELAALPSLALLCGRYEGVDERVSQFVDEELSIGDFVVSGGEIAALVVIDAVSRLVPGVLGSEQSIADESFSDALLEYPQYTRPAEFRGQKVPDVLLSGDHGAIARWRRQQSLRRTFEQRPDLLDRARLSDDDRTYLATLRSRRDG
ncbi:MAG: tRNA (guanosine(37)-N1)-methyltransferase TrmD [Deltaproteobacteria bacterium]|nr:tRNA (guanosine(37)-N1)-methyltransferase TrmD [Deltaproteobacteria bacterium]